MMEEMSGNGARAGQKTQSLRFRSIDEEKRPERPSRLIPGSRGDLIN